MKTKFDYSFFKRAENIPAPQPEKGYIGFAHDPDDSDDEADEAIDTKVEDQHVNLEYDTDLDEDEKLDVPAYDFSDDENEDEEQQESTPTSRNSM